MSDIEKAGVIGAGVMGAGIAAHIANAGVPVILLDVVPEATDNRSAIAEGAIERLLKTDPAPLTHKRNAKRIRPGNIEDHLDQLSDCDWIIEAVVGAVSVPVTLKMRTGWDDDSRNAPELARIAEDCGIQMISVHGRTRCQLYTGRADWTFVARVVFSNLPMYLHFGRGPSPHRRETWRWGQC